MDVVVEMISISKLFQFRWESRRSYECMECKVNDLVQFPLNCLMHNLAAKCTLLVVSVTNFAEKSLKNPAH